MFLLGNYHEGTRVVKCRICVHSFKNINKHCLDRYSGGASTRWGQSAIATTAVQRCCPMASMENSQGFQKGFTSNEVQKIRGGSRSTVSMRLPFAKGGQPSGSALIRQFMGYGTFRDAVEGPEMLKGGFGPH